MVQLQVREDLVFTAPVHQSFRDTVRGIREPQRLPGFQP